MKKSIRNILTLLFVLVLTACKDSFDPKGHLQPSLTANYLFAPEDVIVFGASGGESSFRIESNETPWSLSNSTDWISLSPMKGSTTTSVAMKVSENKSADMSRTAIFYLNSALADWSYSHAVSVSQSAATPSLTVSDNYLTASGAETVMTVDVTANCTWTAECTASWVTLTADVNLGKLTVNVEANAGRYSREAYINLRYGNRSVSINLTQRTATITSVASELHYSNAASKYDVTIDSEAGWTASASADWISVTPAEGDAGKSNVSIEVTPNTSIGERRSYVSFRNGDIERLLLTIVQDSIYIDTPSSLSFGSGEESQKINVESNTSWEIIEKPNWIAVSKTSGDGNGELTVTTADNPMTASRSGEIVFGQSGLSVESRIAVSQSGKYFSLGTSLLQFSDKAQTSSFGLKSDAVWSSFMSDNWFAATPESGNGDAEISVAVEENVSDIERAGTITYNYADQQTFVTIWKSRACLTPLVKSD